MMMAFALPIGVGAVIGVPPFVTIGAFTFFAFATTVSTSRTSHFIIGAPGSWMSGCLFVCRSRSPNCVSSKLSALGPAWPVRFIIATRSDAVGEFVRMRGPFGSKPFTPPLNANTA